MAAESLIAEAVLILAIMREINVPPMRANTIDDRIGTTNT
jgi:hypothetical protein